MKDKKYCIGVNQDFKIVAVNDKSLPTLRYYEFPDTPEDNYFYGWEENLVLKYCYKETKNTKIIYPQQDFLDSKARSLASNVYKEQEKKYDDLVEVNQQLEDNAAVLNGCIMELSELIGELMGMNGE